MAGAARATQRHIKVPQSNADQVAADKCALILHLNTTKSKATSNNCTDPSIKSKIDFGKIFEFQFSKSRKKEVFCIKKLRKRLNKREYEVQW